MHSERAQKLLQILLVLGGVVAAVGGVLALARNQLTFVGRSTGQVVTYTGASSTSVALLWLGVAALLFARAARGKRLVKRVLFHCAIGFFVIAVAVQAYVALK
jgi:hypothetical protein